jgi:hypothetical protein
MNQSNKTQGPIVEHARGQALSVRTDVRAGGSLESCLNNLYYWQKNYNKWLNEARRRGCNL